MLKLFIILISFIFFISIFVYNFVNEPTDWNIPGHLTLIDSGYVVMSTFTSLGFTSNLFPSSERAKKLVMFLQLMVLSGVILFFQNKLVHKL